MKKLILCFVALIFTFGYGQNKKLTMDDAVLGLFTNLRVDNLQLQWIPGTSSYTESVETSAGNALVARQFPGLKTDTLAKDSDFSGRIPNLRWMDSNNARYKKDGKYYIWNSKTKESQLIGEVPADAEAEEFENNSHSIAYVVDNNLYLIDPNGKKHQITWDGSYEIVNGLAVHREEFGVDGGIFFSPQGNYLAFYRMDQSMVEDYPIIDWSTVPAVNKNIKYPFAGRTIHQVKVGVYNPKTEQTIFLKTGEPKDLYLTCVTWSPDEKSIYIATLDRGQKHMKLNQYDAQTGNFIKTLFEERDDKYVEPLNDLYFLPNGKEFLWQSRKDGYNHLYRYDLNGKLLNQVTKGDWEVLSIAGINKAENKLFIVSTKDGAMERHLYEVNWKNGKIKRVDKEPGVHSFNVNSEGTLVIDNWSNETTPRKIDIYDIDGKNQRNLLTADNPLKDYDMPRVENVTLKAADGVTDLYGKLIYPSDFDSTQRYPVIVYLYNGPHAQLNLNRFPASGNLWYDYMAQNGYVVWVMDGRGSANRGLEFERVIFKQLGKNEAADQMKGIEYLKTLPFVNSERMGIHGWSYGGFMTTYFMLMYPDVFKAGVAGGPVLNWEMYEAMYGERYMDSPHNNPEGYAENLMFDKTQNLKGKLLIIHGALDNVVLWQHSVNFIREAVSNGVQVDYSIYPAHEHNVRGKDRVHLMQKVTDYFDLYLK